MCSAGARHVLHVLLAFYADDANADGLPELCEEVLSYTSAISCASFNLLGSLLATGCEDGRVLVWDSQTRAVVREYETHR